MTHSCLSRRNHLAKSISGLITRFLLANILLISILAVAPQQGTVARAQSSPDGQIAYVSDGDILLLDLPAGSITSLTSGGGNSNPAWSADGRYLMYEHTSSGNPSLIVLDMQTGGTLWNQPGACCGAWNARWNEIAYIRVSDYTLTTVSLDGGQPSELWSNIQSQAGIPYGRMAWGRDGQIYMTITTGHIASSVWVDTGAGSQSRLDGPPMNGVDSTSSCLRAPALTNSLAASLSVTVDTSCLAFAPGGPETFVRSAQGEWQDIGMGDNASWSPTGGWLAWEAQVPCSDIGENYPGFCKGGIGVVDSTGGSKQLLVKNPQASQPAWRPVSGNVPAPAQPTLTPTPTVTLVPPTVTPTMTNVPTLTATPLPPTITPVPTTAPADAQQPDVRLEITGISLEPGSEMQAYARSVLVLRIENHGTEELSYWPYNVRVTMHDMDTAFSAQAESTGKAELVAVNGQLAQAWDVKIKMIVGRPIERAQFEVVIEPQGINQTPLKAGLQTRVRPDDNGWAACFALAEGVFSKTIETSPQIDILLENAGDMANFYSCGDDLQCRADAFLEYWEKNSLRGMFLSQNFGKYFSLFYDVATSVINPQKDLPTVNRCAPSATWVYQYFLSLIRKGVPLNLQIVRSPAILQAVDSTGRQTGFLENGAVTVDIPQSTAFLAETDKFVVYPAAAVVTTHLKGTGSGSMTVELLTGEGEKARQVIYQNVPVTSQTIADLNPQDAKPAMHIDPSGSGNYQLRSPDTLAPISPQPQSSGFTPIPVNQGNLLRNICGSAWLALVPLALYLFQYLRKRL